jgi:hypothetical protein
MKKSKAQLQAEQELKNWIEQACDPDNEMPQLGSELRKLIHRVRDSRRQPKQLDMFADIKTSFSAHCGKANQRRLL